MVRNTCHGTCVTDTRGSQVNDRLHRGYTYVDIVETGNYKWKLVNTALPSAVSYGYSDLLSRCRGDTADHLGAIWTRTTDFAVS